MIMGLLDNGNYGTRIQTNYARIPTVFSSWSEICWLQTFQ